MKAIAFFSNKIPGNYKIQGSIVFEQKGINCPVFIYFNLSGLKPNVTHAIHIHEYGDLSDGCNSLGKHFNPYNRYHFHSGMGHVGDLMNNITADKNGNVIQLYQTETISLFGVQKNCIIGRSIVIHEFPDDYGLFGILQPDSTLIRYRDMKTDDLYKLYTKLGYKTKNEVLDRKKVIEKLELESSTTGNASKRIAGAIIGFSSAK
jgi:Cu-Zn family superoxide dismutase